MSNEHFRKDCQESIKCAICFQIGHPSVLHFLNRKGGGWSCTTEKKRPYVDPTGANSHEWRTAQPSTQPHCETHPKGVHHKSPYRRQCQEAPDPLRLKFERGRGLESARHTVWSDVRPTSRSTSIPRLSQIMVEPPTAKFPAPRYHLTERRQPNKRHGIRFDRGRGLASVEGEVWKMSRPGTRSNATWPRYTG